MAGIASAATGDVQARLPFLARSETDRRAPISSIGRLWDGNEVWLLTAGGAMFAAFPLSSSDIGPVEAIPTAGPPPRFAAGQP